MWEQIMTAALSNGLWAALFSALFFYQLKDSRTRERKYVFIIEQLGDRLKTVEDIGCCLGRIEQTLSGRSRGDI